MCDTVLVPPASTVRRIMLFGKNSDRQRTEAQLIEHLPARTYEPGVQVRCTYLAIPQVHRTNAVLLCRPFWMWGAEMGANEHGVVIGNEALHARHPAPQNEALTGMDLLRLALERASTATEAVHVLTTLLERYGQGGNCGHLTPSFYNNGFMIADATEAYVLETIEREWLLESVGGVRSLSNRYSIEREPRAVSAGLRPLLSRRRWTEETEPNYAESIADPHREHIGNAGARRARSAALLRSIDGRAGVDDIMNILRDHGSEGRPEPQWREECATTRTLCMHAGAPDRNGQTVGSLVSELHQADAVHWVTGTAAPCISIFKPILLDVPLPGQGPPRTDRFDPNALWWRHEHLHRAALMGDFGSFIEDIREERDALETDFRLRVSTVLNGGGATERSEVVAKCWEDARAMEDRWQARVSRVP